MRAGRRTSRWLWRWRANPLRRRDDVVEAWLVPAVWTLVAVGGTLAGFVRARSAAEVFAHQRAERTPVRAVLVTDALRASQTFRQALVMVRRAPPAAPPVPERPWWTRVGRPDPTSSSGRTPEVT